MIRIALLLGVVSTLAGCAGPKAIKHRGLSPDGYGFVDNTPILPPPDHLLQPVSLP